MADEEFFQIALDAKLEDSAVRLAFAAWLAERGDRRAAGYRFMAEQHKHPYRSYATWEWWQADSANPPEIILPARLWRKLGTRPEPGYPRCKEWASRMEAEEAVCAILAKQPSKRRPARRRKLGEGMAN